MNTIYTVGTSNRPSLEFIDILTRYGIQILVDVRRFPSSRFPWFTRKNLAAACESRGIDYRWMGDLLGAFRPEAYEEYCRTEDFRKGVECLEGLAEEHVIALCCAERLPWKCHRRFIARALEKLGQTVTHIIDGEEVWQSPQGELF
jgi:uncharacterized protein (DUF488 family)